MADENRERDGSPPPVVVPSEFPVVWENPEDERLHWQADRTHFPEPVTPMMAGYNRAFGEGFKRASQALEAPVRIVYQRINTYNFMAMLPMEPPGRMQAPGGRPEAKVHAAMGRLWEWWDGELLPEVKEYLAEWEAFDLRGASMTALQSHLEISWARLARLWEIHFLIAFPILQAPIMFSRLYGQLIDGEGPLAAYRLLQGLGNKTTEGDLALWELSRTALASPSVRAVLEECEVPEVPAALDRMAGGRDFLSALGAYLEEYGQRSDIFAELGNPNWIENPATAIKSLKEFVSQPRRDLSAEFEALAGERESLVARARDRVKGYPQRAIEQFEFLLKAGQAATIIQEDHNHWIDQRSQYKVRCVLLEFGHRLAGAGVIEHFDDVFHLNPEELAEATAALPHGDWRPLVAERRAEMEHFRTVRQPLTLGRRSAGRSQVDPLSKGPDLPPQPSPRPEVLRGSPGSAGKARGTARVVLSLEEAGKVQPGDILVAPATMPAWTPLFGTVAAVVTDEGGVLSHTGIVAREYRIPAVLGTGTATTVIEDGQTLEVDGDVGLVRIVR